MARNFNGTSHYIETPSAVVSAEPLTMACWFRPSDITVSYVLMSVSEFSSLARHQMTCSGATAGDPVRMASVNAAGAAGIAATSAGYSSGAWHHAAAVISSSSSRSVYLNGGSSGTDSTLITASSINRTCVGASRHNSVTNNPFSGDLAEAAIWAAALTAAEIASLAAGYSPLLIRREALAFYAPLIRNVQDIRGGLALTDAGTTVADHPRIIL